MGLERRLDEFMELADFRLGPKSEPEAVGGRHNVIKRSQIVRKGVEEVGLGEESADDPMVFVQRDGEQVTGVEFVCKCGRSAKLRLEYDEE